MRPIRLGVLVALGTRRTDLSAGALVELAPRIEAAGADALFVIASESLGSGGAEPFTALGAIARRCTLTLGGVVRLDEGRQPSIIAKLATSLALLAPGRTVALFRDPAPRPGLPTLLEAVELADALRARGPVSYAGPHLRLNAAFNEPRPPDTDLPAFGAILDHPDASGEVALRDACDLLLVRARTGPSRAEGGRATVVDLIKAPAVSTTDRERSGVVLDLISTDQKAILTEVARYQGTRFAGS